MGSKFICWMLLGAAVFFQSCSSTAGLKKNEFLYVKGNITISDNENISKELSVREELTNILPEETKSGLFNIYTGLYNIYDSTSTAGFKNWVKNRLGKEPIIYEDQMISKTEARLKYYLNGKGYFSALARCDTSLQDRKVSMTCKISLGNRYIIDSVIFPIDSTYAALRLDDISKRAVLRERSPYDRDKLAYERNRLTTLANENGFAGFSLENVFYYVDTTKIGDSVDIYIDIIQPTDSTVHTRYKVSKINIFPNYALNINENQKWKETKINDFVTVFEEEHFLNHDILKDVIRTEISSYYRKSYENQSINKLLDLGVFRYVNVKNELYGSGKNGRIVQNIFLTPEKLQSINGEFELNNRSGNFLGSGISVSYLHKNMFGGAEQFRLRVGGQVEAQIGDELSFINSSDVNVSAEINFPRFIVPFFDLPHGRNFIPRTVINTNYTFQRRVQYYTLTSALLKYGFRWRETRTKFHEAYPIQINQLNVSNTTPEFEELLAEDSRLQRSFQDVFIAGLQYNFTYNDQRGSRDRNYHFFKAEIETSGNLAQLVRAEKIIGRKMAKFTKVTFDYRHYFHLGNSDIATRIILGGGFAYGKDGELPYIKQYLIGGSNSIRAFRLRGLGPGKFFVDFEDADAFRRQFIDQTGDLKLEMNLEYRFPLFNYLKGALFLDAGNIWLINDEDRPEGNFSFKQFYKDIGIGTGFGFRLDFNFFLLRLDLAFPLRAPTEELGFQWQFSKFDPFSSDWRSNNLRYNLGIGYPF